MEDTSATLAKIRKEALQESAKEVEAMIERLDPKDRAQARKDVKEGKIPHIVMRKPAEVPVGRYDRSFIMPAVTLKRDKKREIEEEFQTIVQKVQNGK